MRIPSASPPCDSTDWTRAIERALPWPLAAGISARRQAIVHDTSPLSGGLARVGGDVAVGARGQGAEVLAPSAGGGMQQGHPIVVLGPGADVEVGAERPGQLVGEERSERLRR